MDDDKNIFVEAIRADEALPSAVREQAAAVESFERHILHSSYLDFLREQIALEPRGPEWTKILHTRLASLAPFCGFPLLTGIIYTPSGHCLVDVDPITRRVIRHETTELA